MFLNDYVLKLKKGTFDLNIFNNHKTKQFELLSPHKQNSSQILIGALFLSRY